MSGESERWAEVVGSPRHRVSTHGRIEVCDGDGWKPAKISQTDKGYRLVKVDGRKTMKSVAHVVLEAFVGPRPAGMFACHFPDPAPWNNRADNLRWDTHQGNVDDVGRLYSLVADRLGAHVALGRGCFNQVVDLLRYFTDEELGRQYEVKPAVIAHIRERHKDLAFGYSQWIWSIKDEDPAVFGDFTTPKVLNREEYAAAERRLAAFHRECRIRSEAYSRGVSREQVIEEQRQERIAEERRFREAIADFQLGVL